MVPAMVAAVLPRLVAGDSADDGAQHGARADGGAGIGAGDGLVLVGADLLVPALFALDRDALDHGARLEDAGTVGETLRERGRGEDGEGYGGAGDAWCGHGSFLLSDGAAEDL